MADNPFMTNVTSTEFQLRNKTKTYCVKEKGGVSSRGDTASETGYFAELKLHENSGKLQYGLSRSIIPDNYNVNDLGYLRRNNEVETSAYIYHQVVKPFWVSREWQSGIWWGYTRVYNPPDVYGHEAGVWSYVLFKNNHGIEFNACFETKRRYFYETRVDGRFFCMP